MSATFRVWSTWPGAKLALRPNLTPWRSAWFCPMLSYESGANPLARKAVDRAVPLDRPLGATSRRAVSRRQSRVSLVVVCRGRAGARAAGQWVFAHTLQSVERPPTDRGSRPLSRTDIVRWYSRSLRKRFRLCIEPLLELVNQFTWRGNVWAPKRQQIVQ